MMGDHARFAPSSADRQELCPGSVGQEEDLPDVSSQYADEGSAFHDLVSQVLTAQIAGDFSELGDPRNYIGRAIVSGERTFYVDQDMAEYAIAYCDGAMIASSVKGALREVEQRVYFGDYLGVPDEEAFGTADFSAVLFDQHEILGIDAKYGMGVKVFAEDNRQMMRYALGLLNKYELVGDFERVRMIIHQPRLDHCDEWVITVDELLAYAERAKAVIAIINGAPWSKEDWPTEFASSTGPLIPGEKQCRFCKAKATCLALRATVRDVVTSATADDFTDLDAIPSLAGVPSDALGAAMDKIGLLEDFAKAVRAEVERRLHREEEVDSPLGGYKLGMGKKGSRQWTDESQAEAVLKSMRFKQEVIYTFKLKSPTQLEKFLAKDSPTRWKKLLKLIGQSDGKPSVMLKSDPRPAITKAALLESFDDLTGDELC